jgi:hypothetical protein
MKIRGDFLLDIDTRKFVELIRILLGKTTANRL